MSWLGARKVLVPDGEAVTLGAADEAAAEEAGAEEAGALGDPVALGDPADVDDPADVLAALAAVELVDELQAVTSKAAQASIAPAATCRDLRDFNSHPFNVRQAARKPCHLYDVHRSALVGNQMATRLTTARFASISRPGPAGCPRRPSSRLACVRVRRST
jgi:hypothetical protein